MNSVQTVFQILQCLLKVHVCTWHINLESVTGQAYCILKYGKTSPHRLSLSSFRSSGGKHTCDDLFIFPRERSGNRSHVEPPRSADKGHDLYGPSLSRKGSQRLHPKGATGGRDCMLFLIKGRITVRFR